MLAGGGRARVDRPASRRARARSARSSGPAPTRSSPTSPPRWPRCSVADGARGRSHGRPAERGAVRAGLPGHPGRRQLAGAGLRRGRRHAVLRRQRRRVPTSTDVDGRRYLDYVQSWGASILGHAHPECSRRSSRAAARGTTFGAPTEARGPPRRGDRRRGARLRDGPPRLVGHRGGDDGVRLARGATGRDRVVKFAGCYHGHCDALLAGGGSGVATLGLPGSAGVPAECRRRHGRRPLQRGPGASTSRVACVIVEPVAANMGLVAPAAGFLEGLRAACDARRRAARSSTR